MLLTTLLVLLLLISPADAFSKCSVYVTDSLELTLTQTGNICEINGNDSEDKTVSYAKGSINGKVFILGGSDVTFQEELVVKSGGYIIVGGLTSVIIRSKEMTISGQIIGNWKSCRQLLSNNNYCGGYPGLEGPGVTTSSAKAGGSHGGLGQGTTGVVYGSFTKPILAGSGGGNGASCRHTKPAGGAAVHIIVDRILTVNGAINFAGGQPAESCSGSSRWTTYYAEGGSAGGSVWIETSRFEGTGSISVNGGDGGHHHSHGNNGMSGGGGRMSISFETWAHTGALTAFGGSSTQGPGQPGTIYLMSTIDSSETALIIDTGKGTNSFGLFPFYDSNDPSNIDFEFDNMQLDGNIDVTFAPVVVDTNIETMLTLRSLQGENTAKITVQNKQTLQILGEDGISTRISSSSSDISSGVSESMSKEDANYDHKMAQILNSVVETPFETSTTIITSQHQGDMLSSRVDITLDFGGTLILPSTVLIAGGQKIIVNGAVVGLRNLIVDADGEIQLGSTGNTVGALVGNYAIDEITLRRGGVLKVTDANLTSTSFIIGSEILGEALSYVHGHGICSFIADHIFVGTRGRIIGTDYGFDSNLGPGSGNNGDGASHGGAGVRNVNIAVIGKGAGYGSYLWPTTMGSGGGGTSGGRGGSALALHAQKVFTHNGIIESNGAKGLTDHGSGAGGSILITAPTFYGAGDLFANGGGLPPDNNGGAVRGYSGGGGRVAVHCQDTTWTGKATTYATSGASSGTVYFDCGDRGKDTLIIDNNEQAPNNAMFTRLVSIDQSLYTLNILDVRGKATFAIDSEGNSPGSDITLRVNKITGDSTGTVHIHSNRVIILSGFTQDIPTSGGIDVDVQSDGTNSVVTKATRTISPTSVSGDVIELWYIEEGGTFATTDNFVLMESTMHMYGTFSGVRHMVVGDNGILHLQDTAKTDTAVTLTSNLAIATVNTFYFETIKIVSNGMIHIYESANIHSALLIVGGGTDITKTANMYCHKSCIIHATEIKVKNHGTINGIGLGYLRDEGPGTSDDSILIGNDWRSNIGGSHGGRGGSQSGELAGAEGGYGSYLMPVTMGSGGSSATSYAGAGGAAIRVKVTNLQVDGTITADGVKGTDNSYGAGGGGAGGSILLEVTASMTGTGIIRSIGGGSSAASSNDANPNSNPGTAGGGGRVALHCDQNLFTGSWQTHGGKGMRGETREKTDGGAGTTYIDCTNHVKHLILDNANYENQYNSLITDKDLTSFEITTLEIKGQARVAFDPENVASPTPVRVDILHHLGDKTGVLNVLEYTTMVLRNSNKVITARVPQESFTTLIPYNELTGSVSTPRSATIEPLWNIVINELGTLVTPDHLTVNSTYLHVKGRLSGPRYVHVTKQVQPRYAVGQQVVVLPYGHVGTILGTTASSVTAGSPYLVSFKNIVDDVINDFSSDLICVGEFQFMATGSSDAPTTANILSFDIFDVDLGANVIFSKDSKFLTHQTTIGGIASTEVGTVLAHKSVIFESVTLKVTSAGLLSGTSLGHLRDEGPGTSDDSILIGNDWRSNIGGSHGGRGGSQSGELAGAEGGYGSYLMPVTMGSGGSSATSYAGAGGAAIRVKVTNLQVDGTITADGVKGTDNSYGAGGGGAGGSILLEVTASMTGTGIIRSIGGGSSAASSNDANPNSNPGTAGGGGRVALHCDQNLFTGRLLFLLLYFVCYLFFL